MIRSYFNDSTKLVYVSNHKQQRSIVTYLLTETSGDRGQSIMGGAKRSTSGEGGVMVVGGGETIRSETAGRRRREKKKD